MQIGSKQWKALIREGATELGVEVDDFAMSGFETHAAEMIQFNRKINLTAITDPFEVAIKHVIDSLAAAPYVFDQARLLDIGSGAGFPGIPIKLVRPTSTVTLIDGVVRKVSFLKHIIRRLKIEGISAHHKRAEQMNRHPDACYDIVISRALSSLAQCIQWALPLVKMEKGVIIALRGHVAGDELRSVDRLLRHGDLGQQSGKKNHALSVQRFSLPFLKDHRTIVRVQFHG